MKAQIYSFVLLALLAVAYAVECPEEDGEFVVQFANPEDCATFWKCNKGVAVLQNCPSGLEYNAELEVCDWAENAGCSAEVAEK